jgi:hypothetical protein
VQVGDQLRIYPGCHKRVLEDCRDRFRLPGSLLFDKGNVRNFRGEPYVPGSQLTAVQAGRAFHRPHPAKEAKRYQVREVRNFLTRIGVRP